LTLQGRERLRGPERLEKAVLDKVQEEILTPKFVRYYIEMALKQIPLDRKLTDEQKTVVLAVEEVEAKLRRWEDALERGLLPLEDAAERIRILRREKASLSQSKAKLEQKARSTTKLQPVPDALMAAYIQEMQKRLRAKNFGYNREFLREIIKEVRILKNKTGGFLKWKIPLSPEILPSDYRGKGFFTLSEMVVAVGLEPTTSRM
jgi:hypothetical protein